MPKWKQWAKYLFVLVAAHSQSWLVLEATCIHDSLPLGQITSNEQSYHESHPFIVGQRHRKLLAEGAYTTAVQEYNRVAGASVSDSAFHPIRITPYYDNSTLNLLDVAKRDVVFKVVPAAIAHFQNTLQVVPVQGNLTAQHSCSKKWNTVPVVCGSFVENEVCFEMPIPQEHFGTTRKCSTCPLDGCAGGDCTYSPSQGVPNSDYLLYVRSTSTSLCTGSVIAYAMACQKDQFDRPTFGMVNFCPNKLSSTPTEYDDQLTAALHEITHALGFSSIFFAYMRNQDGTPKTPRDVYGDLPIKTTGTCRSGKAARYLVEPSSDILEYTTEREHSVAKLITPKVAAFVQQHFDCSSLTGAELESNDPGCIGSHWEERLFESEYMSPVISFRNNLSGLTLAFFEDSGWYKTNASNAQRMVFGADRGCAFATEKCVSPNTSKSIAEDHYCTENTVESCSVDATSRSVCTVQSGLTIPSIYQYFPSTPTKGGPNAFSDYCPLNIGYSGGDCTVGGNLVLPPGTSINILGETYCPTCRCASTTLRSADSGSWLVNSRRATGCYKMQCIWGSTKVDAVAVTVQRSSSGDSVVVNCTSKGEQIQVPGFGGFLSCPDPFIICGSVTPTLETSASTSGSSPDTDFSSSSSASTLQESQASSDSTSSVSADSSNSHSSSSEVGSASSQSPCNSAAESSLDTAASPDTSSATSSSGQSSSHSNYHDIGAQLKPTSASSSGSRTNLGGTSSRSLDNGDTGYPVVLSVDGSSFYRGSTVSDRLSSTTGSTYTPSYDDAGVQPPPEAAYRSGSDSTSVMFDSVSSDGSTLKYDGGGGVGFPPPTISSSRSTSKSTGISLPIADTQGQGSQDPPNVLPSTLDYEDAGPPFPLNQGSGSSGVAADISRSSASTYSDGVVQPQSVSSGSADISTTTMEFAFSASASRGYSTSMPLESGSETRTTDSSSNLDGGGGSDTESTISTSSASEATSFNLRSHPPFPSIDSTTLSSESPTSWLDAHPSVQSSTSPTSAPLPATASSQPLDNASRSVRSASFAALLAAISALALL